MFQINEEDVRLLGDAVTYGKRTSEAMLILRKLNASIRNEFDALEMEDLKLLDSADLMNSNDLKVLSYLAAGFEPKEIARITGLTVPTVYNISSRIRGKLNIPKGDRLKEWVHQEVKRLKSI
jgi:DNA-binding CsgD family transcriptional regulator